MHFSRSLAGVALLGVFAAMAFAGAATGAPAQSTKVAATVLPSSSTGTKLQMNRLGARALGGVAGKPVEKNPYKAVLQAQAKGKLLAASANRPVSKVAKPFGLSLGASSVNATAAATQDQPITMKHPSVISKTGVNAYQQEFYGGYNLEPPDPSLCAGAGFVVQVVNTQIQISDNNLNKLTAPVPLEAFLGDFVNSMFDPLCSYNHSTGRWYLTEAVSDFATFSGVYIAVSTGSDPRGPWMVYFLDLTTFGGDGGCAVSGFCLADQPNLGSDQYTLQISTNQFDLAGGGCASGFCGAAYVLIDKVALAFGLPFPNVVAYEFAGSPFLDPDFLFGDCVTGLGPCWYSIQPADAANGRYDTRNGGTGWAMSSGNFFGGGDNRVFLWRFANTSSIGAFIPAISASAGYAEIGHATYDVPGLAAQPQTVTGPNTANGNPLGDFLVLTGACAAGTPPAGCSNPGPIASRDDRMRDTMMTRTNAGAYQIWGGISAGIPGPDGIMLFGFQLGTTLGSSFLNGFWTIHNPSNDVHYPAVTIQNSGLALVAYGVSGPALRPSGAYSVFSTTMAPAAIQIANQGLGVADGFTQYDAITGFYRPRWGDYSGAWTFNNDMYFTTEYIPDSNCSLAQFIADDTCGPSTGGGTSLTPAVENARKRTFFANWGTSLNKANHP